MRNVYPILGITVIILALIILLNLNFTGKVVYMGTTQSYGPSTEDISCMMNCMNCSSPGVGCTGDSAYCQNKCNVAKPEQTEEEKCVETCALKNCDMYDFECQEKNQEACDKECGMIKEPEAKNEEEVCIRNCVKLKAPGTICQASQEGETGDAVCQECAASCEYLYNGPCLGEEKLEAKKQECKTCENCYAKTIMGPSGEGWDCIVDVECADASSEFGDDAGTGEGIIASIGEGIGNIAESIGNFFSNIFSGEKNSNE